MRRRHNSWRGRGGNTNMPRNQDNYSPMNRVLQPHQIKPNLNSSLNAMTSQDMNNWMRSPMGTYQSNQMFHNSSFDINQIQSNQNFKNPLNTNIYPSNISPTDRTRFQTNNIFSPQNVHQNNSSRIPNDSININIDNYKNKNIMSVKAIKQEVVEKQIINECSTSSNDQKQIDANIDDMEKNILPKLLYDYLKETSIDSAIKEKNENIDRWNSNIRDAQNIIHKLIIDKGEIQEYRKELLKKSDIPLAIHSVKKSHGHNISDFIKLLEQAEIGEQNDTNQIRSSSAPITIVDEEIPNNNILNVSLNNPKNATPPYINNNKPLILSSSDKIIQDVEPIKSDTKKPYPLQTPQLKAKRIIFSSSSESSSSESSTSSSEDETIADRVAKRKISPKKKSKSKLESESSESSSSSCSSIEIKKRIKKIKREKFSPVKSSPKKSPPKKSRKYCKKSDDEDDDDDDEDDDDDSEVSKEDSNKSADIMCLSEKESDDDYSKEEISSKEKVISKILCPAPEVYVKKDSTKYYMKVKNKLVHVSKEALGIRDQKRPEIGLYTRGDSQITYTIVEKDELILGDINGVIKIYKIKKSKSNKAIKVFRGHTKAINGIIKRSRCTYKILSTSINGNLIIFDYKTASVACKNSVCSPVQIHCIESYIFDNQPRILCATDSKIIIRCADTLRCEPINTTIGTRKYLYMKVKKSRLFAGGRQNFLIHNLKNNENIFNIQYISDIVSIDLSGRFVFISKEDGTIHSINSNVSLYDRCTEITYEERVHNKPMQIYYGCLKSSLSNVHIHNEIMYCSNIEGICEGIAVTPLMIKCQYEYCKLTFASRKFLRHHLLTYHMTSCPKGSRCLWDNCGLLLPWCRDIKSSTDHILQHIR